MEQAYKMVLDIIKTILETDEYIDRKVILKICKIALGEGEEEEEEIEL